jgi:hypothetical protein
MIKAVNNLVSVYIFGSMCYKLSVMARKKQTKLEENEIIEVVSPVEQEVPAPAPVIQPVVETRPATKQVKKRFRVRKKGPKKLSMAVLCSSFRFGRFA